MHQTGIIKIAQFDGAIEFYSRPTPVPMVTKWLFLNRKLAVARLCKNMAQSLVPNTMSQTSDTITIFLATVTKFCEIINKTANITYKKTVTAQPMTVESRERYSFVQLYTCSLFFSFVRISYLFCFIQL